MDADMLSRAARQTALLIILIAGCDTAPPRQPPPPAPPIVPRPSSWPAAPKPQPIPDQARTPDNRVDDLDDRTPIIPPPRPELPGQPQVVEPPPGANIELAHATKLEAPVVQVASIAPVANLAVATVQKEGTLAATRRIHQEAAAAYARLNAFEARLNRRETVNGKSTPQEIIAFKFRKEPLSVRLKWLGAEGQGREVIYVQGQHDGKMHVMPTRQDSFPLPPMRMAFLPDDPMVRSKSRHDIREAGFGESIRQLGNVVHIVATNPAERDRLRYLGLVTRPEYPNPMEAIEEIIPARAELLFPQGGKRVYFFDTGANSPSKSLPVVVVAYDNATRKEAEYYCFDNFMHPINIGDKDFDPELVWKKK
jgi:hypothetical protein